jgi:hypothetical protein
MDPILLTIVVVLVAVFGVAIYMDLKRKRMRDTKSGGVMGQDRNHLRRSDREKGERWGGGGG